MRILPTQMMHIFFILVSPGQRDPPPFVSPLFRYEGRGKEEESAMVETRKTSPRLLYTDPINLDGWSFLEEGKFANFVK